MRIAIVTGSRADRGALEMVSPALERAGHEISWINVRPDVPARHALAAADNAERASWSTRYRLRDWRVDMIILHGDRHEILGAAMAANIMGVPIAHLGGGDVTEGSQDDCFRHAITKLSHLHFATNEESARRIVQMGEEPGRVHVTGDPGVDRIRATKLLDREAAFRAVGLQAPHKALLVSFHPNTLGDTAAEVEALCAALRGAGEGVAIVAVGPNADAGSQIVRDALIKVATAYSENLPGDVFLSLLKHCDALVGNSSAGFYEAPSFGLPAVNVGDRQRGRPIPASVIQSDVSADAILAAIGMAMSGRVKCENPYGDGHACERIVGIVGAIADPKALLRKRFHDADAR